MSIEIQNPELEAKIRAQAQARGVSVEALIASMIEGLNGVHSDTPESEASDLAAMRDAPSDKSFTADPAQTGEDEFIQAMESMAADVPPLPRDFSREDIYFPRD